MHRHHIFLFRESRILLMQRIKGGKRLSLNHDAQDRFSSAADLHPAHFGVNRNINRLFSISILINIKMTNPFKMGKTGTRASS